MTPQWRQGRLATGRTTVRGIWSARASRPLHGFVAIRDALGAKNFSGQEAEQFLKSRDEFIPFISNIAEEQIKIDSNDFQRFIFNDTVILTYVRGRTFRARNKTSET